MLEALRNRWRSEMVSEQSNISFWRDMAGRFGKFPLPRWDKDGFLRLLDASVDFDEGMRVMDIGCGTGTYAIPLSERVKEVTAVDISPEMLDYARVNAAQNHRDNIDFVCADWIGVDLIERRWEKRFDLVIAHNSPAIADTSAFEKMIASSNKYCFLAKPTRRNDSVTAKLSELLGHSGDKNSVDESMMISFAILWYRGLLPEIHHFQTKWRMKKTLDEATEFYINKMKIYHDLNQEQEKAIMDYLESVADENYVYEKTETAITTIAWRNDGIILNSSRRES